MESENKRKKEESSQKRCKKKLTVEAGIFR
jgi:hypothetical protein